MSGWESTGTKLSKSNINASDDADCQPPPYTPSGSEGQGFADIPDNMKAVIDRTAKQAANDAALQVYSFTEEQLEELRTDLKRKENELGQLQKQYDKEQRRNSALKEKIREKEREIKDLKEVIDDKDKMIRKMSKGRQSYEQQIVALEAETKQKDKLIKEQDESLKKAQEDKERQEKELDTKRKLVAKLGRKKAAQRVNEEMKNNH